jgi:tripartite-type tricarboxylate transporter receptor subunit TctC
MLFTPASMLLLTPLLQKLSFDPDKQLLPVTNVGTGAQVIAIKRELPAHTLPESLAYAKANPGKLNFAVAGTQNISHLAPVLLFARAGVNLVMVPGKRRGAGHLRSDRGPSGFLFWQRLAVAAPCRY